MKANTLCLMLAALLSGGAHAQAIMQHAAAAAGATVGTAGGKALSNVLDNALSKAAETGTQASTEKKPGTKPSPLPSATPAAAASPLNAAGPVPAAPSTKTAVRITRASRPSAPSPKNPILSMPEQRMPTPAAALAPPPPSEEDFAKVKEGSARQDVFAALGTPSSRITIPDEGHLIEILSYSDGARRLGSVRMDNGQVVSVSTAQR